MHLLPRWQTRFCARKRSGRLDRTAVWPEGDSCRSSIASLIGKGLLLVSNDRQRVISEVRFERLPEGVSVVFLVGEHDLATRSEIETALDSALESGDAVAVDLSAADFIDSSTLHVLLAAARRATESGRGFALVLGQEDSVRQVFELTGLLTQFESASSLDAAVETLRRPR
jgi:anti-sigma B factor antagonist